MIAQNAIPWAKHFEPHRAHALLVRLRGAGRNTEAIGARIPVTSGSRAQIRDVRAGSSYLSQNDLRAISASAPAALADRMEVLWPSGRTETLVTT